MLLASIHDVGPRFAREVDILVDRLSHLLDGPRFAMLVVPDHWNEAPLASSPDYARKLRDWSDSGVEMFLHGWSHRDDAGHAGLRSRLKAHHMTAGEGEFLGLGRAEARRRMQAGRAVLEDAIGRPLAGFIAPAWLYSKGALEALGEEGFSLAEDHFRVWRPVDGRVVARGPVITWASRTTARMASSLAFASLARATAPLWPGVRIAVHPGDTGEPHLLDSIDRTIRRFAAGRSIGRYRDLL